MPDGTIALIRRILFATLAIGVVGTEAELLLLEHFDDWKQYSPLILLALMLVAQGWFVAARSSASVRAVRGASWLAIVSGAVGVLLHYRGNMEFEREMTPSIAGTALFKEAMMGATPALAPGAMIQLGLIGLAWAFRHPLLDTISRHRSTNDPES
jgi:ABC-type amino acid transport system permease subunit